MRILTDCSFLTEDQIEMIESKFDGKYVFESQIKMRSAQWSEFSAAVFFTELPHPKGSNWFGVWIKQGKFMIGDAVSAVEEPFIGALAENGDIIYSRHTYDYRESDDKTVFIDGGRKHCRHDLTHEIIKLQVFRDKVSIVPRQSQTECCVVPYREELNGELAAALFLREQASLPLEH